MLTKIVSVAALAVLIPSLAAAQASITGVVRDASGGVLPGVTVETASPALIERVRTGTTDGTGQYRIEDLRPGVYTVSFSLPGFSTVKREGIELTGTFVATISVDLRVGELAETVVVTGTTPVVDIQSTTRQRVMDHQVIDAIPSGRTEHNLALLIPGVTMGSGATISQDVGGTADQNTSTIAIHGGRTGDQRIMQNGVSMSPSVNSSSNILGLTNTSAVQEVAIDTAAVSAELSTGGIRVNFIPKDGGNTYTGTAFASFTNDTLQSNNFSDALKAAGLSTPDALKRNWDVNPGFGGPLLKDGLWFYTAYRNTKNETYPAGAFTNLNATNPNAWTYAPDLTSRPFNQISNWDVQARLTWQVARKVKIGLGDAEQYYCACSSIIGSTVSPEAAYQRLSTKQRNLTADWTVPLTNRLLIDGAVIHRNEDSGRRVPPEYASIAPQMIAVTDQALGNLVYRTADIGSGTSPNLRASWYKIMNVRTAISYITGAHSVKAGVNIGSLSEAVSLGNRLPGAQPFTYRFNNGVPNQITLFAYPLNTVFNTDQDSGAFVQDRWTIKRLTASFGVRLDWYANSFPAEVAGPTALLPTRNLSFPETDGVAWKDLTPKMGVAYDLFGDGKTAIKVSLNKYLQGMGSDSIFGAALNPLQRFSNVTTRSWTDRNGNFVPDCDLRNPVAQTVTGGDICGASTNQNFGLPVASASYNQSLMSGWGVRSYNWEFSAGVQREILPRVSVDVSLFRRWYGNFFVTDNRAVAASDYTTFGLTAPSTDSRLPTAGQAIAGYLDLNPNKVGQVDNYITTASDYGGQTENWTGLDVNVSARLHNGLLVQGGTGSGRTSTDSCGIRAQLPETAVTNPFCSVTTPFLTQVKFLAAYTVPRLDLQIGGTVQSIPGPIANASYNAPNAVVQPSLGRALAGNAANVTIPLIAPSTLYADRLNQVDFRVGKILRFSNRRVALNLDVFNVLNGNVALSVNNTFGGTTAWQKPLSILTARFIKIGTQIDF